MRSTTHTGGLKEFDGSGTVDLPYKCKDCGKNVSIEKRHSWLHDCIDESLIEEIREDETEPISEIITEPDEIKSPDKSVKEETDGAIHTTIIHIGKRKILLTDKEYFKGTDWFRYTYYFKTKKDAEWVFKQAKNKNSNVVEDKEDDSQLDRIQLRKSSDTPSITFIYNSKPDKKVKKPIKDKKKILLVSSMIVIILIIVGIIYLDYYNTNYSLEEDITLTEIPIEKEQPVFEEIPIEISFSEYLNNIDGSDNKLVTLKGFLSREIEGSGSSGVYVEYIIDDFNNKIQLLNLNKEQITLFPKTGKTDEIYDVKGKFKKKYQGLDLEVNSMIVKKNK